MNAAPMNATPIVRPARPADLPAARDVVLAAYGQYAAVAPAEVFPTYLADVLDVERHAHFGPLLVVEVDGRMLATVTFHPDARVQSLGWPSGWASGRSLAVHPDARGLGLARVLLLECERRAQEVGAPVFAFHTGNFMLGARRLYDQLGYCRIPEYDVDMGSHYGIAGPGLHLGIAYCRELPET